MRKWLIVPFFIFVSGCASGSKVNNDQFVVGQQTVLDSKSGLMWAHSDNRQSLTWQEAVDYCENYTGGGYEDWRMPSVSDIQTLIEEKIDSKGDLITITSNMIWAAETDDSKAAFCHLANRGCSWMEQVISISLRALPVRDNTPTTIELEPVTQVNRSRPQSTEQRLQVLDLLYKQNLITKDEYTQKKSAILNEL